MSGPEHYAEAERLVERGENDDLEPELTALDHQRALIHAMLAIGEMLGDVAAELRIAREQREQKDMHRRRTDS